LFEDDSSLGVMEDCYENLKAKSTCKAHLSSTLTSFITPQQTINSKPHKNRLHPPSTMKSGEKRRKNYSA
jgi:hypothetical protein